MQVDQIKPNSEQGIKIVYLSKKILRMPSEVSEGDINDLNSLPNQKEMGLLLKSPIQRQIMRHQLEIHEVTDQNEINSKTVEYFYPTVMGTMQMIIQTFIPFALAIFYFKMMLNNENIKEQILFGLDQISVMLEMNEVVTPDFNFRYNRAWRMPILILCGFIMATISFTMVYVIRLFFVELPKILYGFEIVTPTQLFWMFDTPINTNNVPVCLILGKQQVLPQTHEKKEKTEEEKKEDEAKEKDEKNLSETEKFLNRLIESMVKKTKALHKFRKFYFQNYW